MQYADYPVIALHLLHNFEHSLFLFPTVWASHRTLPGFSHNRKPSDIGKGRPGAWMLLLLVPLAAIGSEIPNT
jgi:hypothetical protein